MNKRLTIILVIVFALILTFLVKVVEVPIIKDQILVWSIGSIVLANVIGVLAGKMKTTEVRSPADN